MGACLSRSGRLSSGGSKSSKFDTIRLVHFNGYVEDFNPPLTVGEVIGKPPKQYVCSASQLISIGFKPLPPQTQLQPSTVYLVLPVSVMKEEFSPLDIASLAKRLTEKAKSVDTLSPKITPSPSRGSDVVLPSSPRMSPSASLSAISSPGRSPRRTEAMTTSFGVEADYSCRSRGGSWKPSLDAIREASFARRSDSDLREIRLITNK